MKDVRVRMEVTHGTDVPGAADLKPISTEHVVHLKKRRAKARKPKVSPTKRSLDWLRKQGYLCAVVEKWNAHAGIRQDLFGFIDIVALRGSETMGVQSTSFKNKQAHLRKIADAEHLPRVRSAQWTIHLHAWRDGHRAPEVTDVS